GYVYFAQPPLYRVKVGREQFYLEKESQLEDLLIRERLSQIAVLDASEQPIVLDEARYQGVVRLLREYEGWANRMRAEFGSAAADYVRDSSLLTAGVQDLAGMVAHFEEGRADDAETEASVVTTDEEGQSLLVRLTERYTGTVSTLALPVALL